MKKKISFVVIIISIIFLLIILYNFMNNYMIILRMNWNISFPIDVKLLEVYTKSSPNSFHGDGIRYHIYTYKENDESKIENSLNWSKIEKVTIFNLNYKESIENWLKQLDISNKYYPNYENIMYFYKSKEDNSEIIIVLEKDEKRLYIIESFL